MLALLALLLFPVRQSDLDTRGEIDVGNIRSIAERLNGDVWVGSEHGRLYISRDRLETWAEVDVPTKKAGDRSSDSDVLEHIDFLDERHAVISGSIGARTPSVLRTEDAGATWSRVALPRIIPTSRFVAMTQRLEMTVNATSVGPDGTLWLATDTGSLLATRDRGATFELVGRPFDGASCDAVAFRTSQQGVVYTSSGYLRVTGDGGLHWRDMPCPVDVVTSLAFAGERVMARGPGSVRVLDLASGSVWSAPVTVEGHAVQVAAGTRTGLIGVLDDRRVASLTSDLSPTTISTGELRFVPSEMSVSGARAVFHDGDDSVAHFDGREPGSAYMFSAKDAGKWPLRDFDFARDGRAFATGKHGFFTSSDAGAKWSLRAQAERFGSVWAFADGSGALVDRDGHCTIWDEKSTSFEEIAALRSLRDVPWVVRRGDLWLALGFLHDGDPRTIARFRIADTVYDGPGFTALVFGSTDGGRTWSRVHEVGGTTICGAFLGDDDVLSLLLWDKSLLRIPLRVEGSRVIAREDNAVRTSVPDLPLFVGWLEFHGNGRGSYGGRHHVGTPMARTTDDGGRTWKSVKPTGPERRLWFHRLGSGSWVRRNDADQIELRHDDQFELLRRFEKEIHATFVDATGRLVVHLEDSDVWALSPDASEWMQLQRQTLLTR